MWGMCVCKKFIIYSLSKTQVYNIVFLTSVLSSEFVTIQMHGMHHWISLLIILQLGVIWRKEAWLEQVCHCRYGLKGNVSLIFPGWLYASPGHTLSNFSSVMSLCHIPLPCCLALQEAELQTKTSANCEQNKAFLFKVVGVGYGVTVIRT